MSTRDLTFRTFGYADHCGPQEPVFQFVAWLQLVEYVAVGDFVGFYHFDRLVLVRVEGFAFGVDYLQTQLAEGVEELLGDQLDAGVEVGGGGVFEVDGAVEAVEDRK